jgi:hypothetical protein
MILELIELPERFMLSKVYRICKKHNQMTVAKVENCCHFNLSLRTYDEICCSMDTLQYWQFEKTPMCLYENIAGREAILRKIVIANQRELFLRYPNFKPFLEFCILVLGDSIEEKYEMANFHALHGLMDYLRGT